MPLTCPHCDKMLDISGEAPRFCPYCGQGLGVDNTSGFGNPTSTLDDPNATVAFTSGSRTIPAPRSNGHDRSFEDLPDVLGGFRIVRLLGQGGMGTVHEAEDIQTGRRVAVKVMAPEFMPSPRAVERFLQEGRLASTISHPRCVFVLAADETRGWPFIVMELMPGSTLKDVVESQGPMSTRRAIETILDVIEGLEEAHRRGVIHRDVKPSNCFIDADDRIKVGDFGLSKSIVDDSGLTRTGTFIGTPHFASPEQIKGEAIDERSDVYSVCATLFYLITGHPPFEGADAASTLAKIVSDPLPSARTHRPDLWIPLDRVIIRGLERDRRRRWSNLEELRHALSPFLPGRVNLSSLGLRIGAYAFDFLLGFVLISIVMAAVDVGQLGNWARSTPRLRKSDFILEEITSGFVILLYYSLSEILGEASPGKRLLRLRVGSAEAGPAPSRSRAIRLAIYLAGAALPRRLCVLVLSAAHFSQATIVWSAGVAQLVGPLVLFCTARPTNGYRGLHEFLSGTAVVRLPWRFRRRRKANEVEIQPTFHLARPLDLPPVLGSFKVQGALRWSDGVRLLQAEDEGLRRLVWIVMRPVAAGTTARARTDLARLTRLRWLQSGASEGWRWDAFVAPTGTPLIAPGTTQQPRRTWSEMREILEELANELVDATCDGTLPSDLAINQIWIKPNGRVLLLDAAPHEFRAGGKESDHVASGDPQQRGLELIGRVAMALLHGGHPAIEGGLKFEGTPIPRHAVAILEGLRRPGQGYRSIEAFREAIHSIRDHPAELTPIQQLGHASYTLLGGLVKVWFFQGLVLAYIVVATVMTHGEPQRFTEELFRKVLMFEMFLWVFVAMMVREGPAGWVFNVGLVTTRGRLAGRLRFAWREALVVAPVLIVVIALDWIPASSNPLRVLRAYGGFIFACLWPCLNVLPIFLAPGRYLVDRLAGTVLVPR